MPVIPSSEQLGRVQPQSRRSFVGAPRDVLSPAVQRAGQTLQQISGQLFQKAEEDAREAERLQEFQTEAKFIDFQNQQDQVLIQAGEAAEPGAIGFTRSIDDGYDAAAREFMKGLDDAPEELKAKYDAKLVNLRGQVFANADKFERGQRDTFYNTRLDDQTKNAALIVREDPSRLEEQVATLGESINASGLTPPQKADRRRTLQPVLVAEAIQGLTEQGNFDGARGLLDKYVNAATSRGSAATAASGGKNNVVDRIIHVESGGKADAKAKTSTATGLGQFIESTWIDMVLSHRPDLAKGKSRAEVLALRTNPDLSREMTARYVEENAQAITAAGHKATAGNVYLAHFLGPGASGGAVAVLNADDDTPLDQILSADKIKANAFLKGKTVGWLKNWSANKMGDAAPVIDIGPKWVEKLETDIANGERRQRDQVSTTTRESYDLSIVTNPAGVSESEIFNDLRLNDGDKASLIKSLRSANKDQQDLIKGLQAFEVGRGAFNERDPESRKQVDAIFKETTNQNINDQETQKQAQRIVERTGIVPRPVSRTIQSGVNSQNPNEVAIAAQLATNYYKTAPRSFDGQEGAKDVVNAAVEWNHLTNNLGLSDERAAQELINARDPAQKRNIKELNTLAKEQLEDLTPSRVADRFEKGYFATFLATPSSGHNTSEQLAFLSDYKELYEINFRESGGNTEIAEARTKKDMEKLYGPSEFSGQAATVLGIDTFNPITKFPIENYYPPVADDYTYIRDQMFADVKGALPDLEIDPEDIILLADEQTQADINAERPPKYQLLYKTEEDGIEVFNSLPTGVYFRPDLAQAQAEATVQREQEFEARQLATSGVDGKYVSALTKDNREVIIDASTRQVVEKDDGGKYRPTGERYDRISIVRPTGQTTAFRGFEERENIEEVLAREAETKARRAARIEAIREKQAQNFRNLGFDGQEIVETLPRAKPTIPDSPRVQKLRKQQKENFNRLGFGDRFGGGD